MSIDLIKGQKIELTRNRQELTRLKVGLGWDPMEGRKMDIDASAVLLNAEGKLSGRKNLVHFGNQKSPCGSVVHGGDNVTGEGEGDDESIQLFLGRMPEEVQRVVFIVNIFRFFGLGRKKDFGMVENAYIRILNPKDGQELLRFNLTEDYSGMCSIRVGEVYRQDGEWKFSALGEGSTVSSLAELTRQYE